MSGPRPAHGAGDFSHQGLAALAEMLRGEAAAGRVAGAVALLAGPRGAWQGAVGRRDLASGQPLRPDAIFDIASMTKPMLATLALMLVEEGVLALDAPVQRWLPELADRRVLRHLDSELDDTVPAARPITVEDLLTLRLGIGAVMAPPGRYPIQRAIAASGTEAGFDRPRLTPDAWIAALGRLPLMAQPGERWLYHTGFDVLAVLLARAGGCPLEQLLGERLLDPLGMVDTGFTVPARKLARVARRYTADDVGRLRPFDATPAGPAGEPLRFPSEVYSTAADLLAFGRFLLAGGEHAGRSLLSPASVAAMTRDQITPAQKAISPFFPGFWETHGWGYGLGLTLAPDGTVRRYGWGGGLGTDFACEPGRRLLAVLLSQRTYDATVGEIAGRFWRCVEAAALEP